MTNRDKKPKRVDIFEEFILWSAMPPTERAKLGIETQEQFCAFYKIGINTPAAWKRRREYEPRVTELRRQWAFERTGMVIEGIYRSALKGNPHSQKLWLQYFHGFSEKQEVMVAQVQPLPVDDILFLIEGLPEEKRQKYYSFIADLVYDASVAEEQAKRAGDPLWDQPPPGWKPRFVLHDTHADENEEEIPQLPAATLAAPSIKMGRRSAMCDEWAIQTGTISTVAPTGAFTPIQPSKSAIKRTVVVDEEQAGRVRFMYENYARGVGDRKLVLEMNERGWKPSRGTRWTISAVRYILVNPTYIGKVWWGWKHADSRITREWRRRGKLGYIGNGTHTPIIDEALYSSVQQVRAGRSRSFKGAATLSRGLLTGIAKCIRCGSGVGYQKRFHNRSKKNPNWRNTYTNEYICTGYKYRGICTSRVMSATRLETEVISRIKDLYMHPKVQESIIYSGKGAEENDREREIARLEREIAMEDEKLERQREAYERGILSIEEYEAIIGRIRAQTGSYHAEAERLRALQYLTAQRTSAAQKLVASLRDFDTLWAAMEMDEKKMLLRSIIREIGAGDGRVEVDFIL